jgi:hypothetical protein
MADAAGGGAEETNGQFVTAQTLRSDKSFNTQKSQSIIRNSQPLAQDDDSQVVDDQGVSFQDDDLSVPNVNGDDPLALDDDLLVFSQDNDDESLGILIEKPYFNRTFQPYDWYVKAKTWVSAAQFCLTPEQL